MKRNGIKEKFQQLFGIDLRSLALFRMCIALVIIIDVVQRFRDLEPFYSDSGIFTRIVQMGSYNTNYISLNMISGSLYVQAFIFLMAILFALFLLIGFNTKLSTIVSWFLLLSVHVRNPILSNGGDELLRQMLFWSMFLPLGACYSVDSILNPSKEKSVNRILSMATIAILAQIVLMYLITIVFKHRTEEWTNGTAVYYALSHDHYITPFGRFLFSKPELMKILTYGAYWFEFIGTLLLFSPIVTVFIRTLMILAFILFQIGMGSSMEIAFFPWVSSISMILFLPSQVWDNIILKLSLFNNISGFLNRLFSNSRELFNRLAISKGAISVKQSIGLNVIVLFLFVYVLAWNYWTLYPKYQIPNSLQWIGHTLRIDQKWAMYAPPTRTSFWFVFVGTLKDGTKVDVFRDGKPVKWKTPKYPTKTFKNRHWRAFLLNLGWFPNARANILPNLSWYFCRKWNENHSGDKKLAKLETYLMYKEQLPDYKASGPHKYFIWEYFCN